MGNLWKKCILVNITLIEINSFNRHSFYTSAHLCIDLSHIEYIFCHLFSNHSTSTLQCLHQNLLNWQVCPNSSSISVCLLNCAVFKDKLLVNLGMHTLLSFYWLCIKTVAFSIVVPPQWNPPWQGERLIKLRGFHPSASTSGACWSDVATPDKDKQICFMLMPRTCSIWENLD